MIHFEDNIIKKHLFQGQFGLELESHRITPEGTLSHTPHPFPEEPHIARDFSEDQVEINTSPCASAKEARDELVHYLKEVHRCLAEKGELLWPFSNPPYIRNEEDIHIAQYFGEDRANTTYREFLSERYGRYLMTYSGIHVNYSFSEEMLRRNFELEHPEAAEGLGASGGSTDGARFREYKDMFYLKLSEKAATYGWLLVVLMAASPIEDLSFVRQGEKGSYFTGLASPRCSEFGYWNQFSPIMEYSNLENYIKCIESYVEEDLLVAARELYYPIRIKPAAKYSMANLREQGVNHIELRMYDLNPLDDIGLEQKDIEFAQLFLIWLQSIELPRLTAGMQAQTVQNFKNASHYDLDRTKVVTPDGVSRSLRVASLEVLDSMETFFRSIHAMGAEAGTYAAEHDVEGILAYQRKKLEDESFRYANRVLRKYDEDYLEKGIELAKARQKAGLK